MYRNLYLGVFTIFIVTLFTVPSLAQIGEDPCREKGLVVRNMTMLDLWDKRKDGDCFIWKRDKLLVIKPEDTIEIFSDSICKTQYCKDNPNYDDYKSFDTDGNCRIKILSNCTFSDM
jgi:hypothetical protein